MAVGNDGPITPKRMTVAQMMQLWGATSQRFRMSRQNILYCQSVQHGGEGVIRPDLQKDPRTGQVKDPGSDPLTTTLPQRWQIPLAMVNTFAEDYPEIVRKPIGSSTTAKRDAELYATFLNAAIDQTLDVEELFAKGVEDAEYALVITPATDHFIDAPTFMDTIPAAQYERLKDDDEKDEYEPYVNRRGRYVRKGPDGSMAMDPRWKRDGRGRAEDDPNYSKRVSLPKSREAYDEAYQAYLASKPPWSCRIVSALDCAPILIHGRGKKRFEARGLMIRTLYAVEDLLTEGYIWDREQESVLIPTGYDPENTYGAYGQVYLYEAHLMVDGHPIIAYSVAGRPTQWRSDKSQRDSEQVDAVLDLYEEWGICRLMVGYFYGLHTGSDNPDARGIPLLLPLAKSIVGAESLLTATNVHAWKNSFAGYFLPIDPAAPRESYLEQNGQLKKFKMPDSGQVEPVPGIPVPAAPAEVGDTARYMVEQLLRQVETNRPEEGRPGVTSGHGLSVSADLERAARRQIPLGVADAVEFTAECIGEICTAIRDRYGVDVGIWINEELEPGADVASEPATQQRILTLQQRWVGGVYKVDAVYPEKGNLAEVSLISDLQGKGQATMEDLLVARGKENPAAEAMKLAAEKILTGTPEGQMATLANALRWRGENERANQIELQLTQRLTQLGVPTAAMAGPPMVPTGAAPEGAPGMGTDMPDIAGAVRGGIVSGEVGQQSAINDARAQVNGTGPQPGLTGPVPTP